MAKVRVELEKENPAEKTGRQHVSSGKRNEISKLLIKSGMLTEEQLRYAQRVHAKLTSQRSLLSILEELQYVTKEQVQDALRAGTVAVPLGSLLVELGYISEADLAMLLDSQKEHRSAKFGQLVVDLNLIDENDLLKVLSYQLGFPYIEPAVAQIEPKVIERGKVEVYLEHRFLPLHQEGDGVLVAFADPLNYDNVQAARKIFGESLVIGIGRDKAIIEALNRYETKGRGVDRQAKKVEASDNAVVAAVNALLLEAHKQNASDVHIEPMKDRLQIRFRRDGVLVPYKDFPIDMAPGMTSRIKIMAGADIAERRRHQDGRIYFEEQGVQVDLRVSIYVTIYGEKIVLRLLGRQGELRAIDELGLAPRILLRFREEALDAPSGVIIITGPTGSGKTSTLYSAVNHLNSPSCSIITAEDPVEYVIEGISQCSINPKINVTFEETLKHIVRQDPDIIVIGEIRDRFSAEMAIEAALTGHKVLTTFHTEDSTGALLRLLDMQIEAFLIASTVAGILAQRLVRRVCPDCAEEHPLTPDELRRLGYGLKEGAGLNFKKGRGCRKCRYSGYKGRLAIHELLIPGEMVKDAVIARKTSHEIRKINSQTTGLVTLLEDGICKASQGLTSFNEVIRQLPRLDRPRPLVEVKRMLGVH
ncbi:MAG: Flp pilus assembly complex ATPase component TadA [Deltaproteobacteria bacterium]|nr:Flp pilus assembly complex ATPase component TadA [Deltaproteobacteria bacterium]